MQSVERKWNKLFRKCNPEIVKKYFETLVNKREYDCKECYSWFVLEFASFIGKPLIETDLEVLIERFTVLWRIYFKTITNCKNLQEAHDHESSGSEEECECIFYHFSPITCFECYHDFYFIPFISYLEEVYCDSDDNIQTLSAFYYRALEKMKQCEKCIWD